MIKCAPQVLASSNKIARGSPTGALGPLPTFSPFGLRMLRAWARAFSARSRASSKNLSEQAGRINRARGSHGIGILQNQKFTNTNNPDSASRRPGAVGHGSARRFRNTRSHPLRAAASWHEAEAGELSEVGRTISTEQGAERSTACATLPRKNREMAPSPREPTMTRSAFHSRAKSGIAFLG